MARSYVQQGFVATLTRDVATPDTSIYLDKTWGLSLPVYLTLDPLNSPEVVLVSTVTDVGGGEFRYDVTRDQGPNNVLTHLTGQPTISAFSDPAFEDIWTEIVALQNVGYRQIAAADSPYTMVKSDQIVSCWYDSGPIVVNLPTGVESINQGVLIQSFGAFGGSNTTTIIAPSALIFTDGIGVSQKILNGPGTLWSGYNVGTGDDWSTTGERGSIS